MPARAAFVVPFALLLAGCGPGTNPALELGCADRAPGTLLVGTGAEEFEPVAPNGVDIQQGPQGGYHVWIGLRCQNMGPHIDARYGITDKATGAELSLVGLRQSLDLTYNEDASADDVAGLYGYLSDTPPGSSPPPPDQLKGRQIVLWAKVNDQCDKPVESTLETVVRTYK